MAIINPRPTSKPITTSSATGKPTIEMWWLLGALPEPKRQKKKGITQRQEEGSRPFNTLEIRSIHARKIFGFNNYQSLGHHIIPCHWKFNGHLLSPFVNLNLESFSCTSQGALSSSSNVYKQYSTLFRGWLSMSKHQEMPTGHSSPSTMCRISIILLMIIMENTTYKHTYELSVQNLTKEVS